MPRHRRSGQSCTRRTRERKAARDRRSPPCPGTRQWAWRFQMTDGLALVLIPYARFLEVRARRLDIVTELTQPIGQRADNVTASSAPIADNERARAAVRVLAVDP